MGPGQKNKVLVIGSTAGTGSAIASQLRAQGTAYQSLQIVATTFSVVALSSAPKDAGGETGATAEVVTIICNLQ